MSFQIGDMVQHWIYGKGEIIGQSWFREVLVKFDMPTDGIRTRSMKCENLQKVF